MKFIAMFSSVPYYMFRVIAFLIAVFMVNGSPFRAKDMADCSDKCLHHKCVKSGDNSTNTNKNGSSVGSGSTKFSTSDDNSDKDKEDDNNNQAKPVITNYYCYDQRVYNIYKLHESGHKSRGFCFPEAIGLLNWYYIFILLAVLMGLTAILCCCWSADLFNWLIFHKVFGYLFNNHLVVVRTDVPV